MIDFHSLRSFQATHFSLPNALNTHLLSGVEWFSERDIRRLKRDCVAESQEYLIVIVEEENLLKNDNRVWFS